MEFTEYGYRIGKTVKNWDICEGNFYGSHWGLTDLYPNCEANLRTLLSSGEDFRAEWDSKKELLSAEVMRINGKLRVVVSAWMDDLWESDDLIYDALWDACKSSDDLAPEVIEAIRDAANDSGIEDHAYSRWEGQCDDYEALMHIVSDLADFADEDCQKYFGELKTLVEEAVREYRAMETD